MDIAGYYIGNLSGNPATFRLMFQHYAYENFTDWVFDGTIATTQGKGKATFLLKITHFKITPLKTYHLPISSYYSRCLEEGTKYPHPFTGHRTSNQIHNALFIGT